MQTILFDLDGTLIDHFTTIHRSVVHTQRTFNLPESDYDTVRATVGGSVPVTLGKLLGEEYVEAAVPIFQKYFESIMFEDLLALSGSAWLLETLKAKGHPLAVFTNKNGDQSRATLTYLKMDQWLDAIVGTGDTPEPCRKPESAFSQYILDRMNSTGADTIMIGDSPFDFQAAEVAGMACYLVATGSHDTDELRAHTSAAGVYQDLYQLAEDVFELTPTATVN